VPGLLGRKCSSVRGHGRTTAGKVVGATSPYHTGLRADASPRRPSRWREARSFGLSRSIHACLGSRRPPRPGGRRRRLGGGRIHHSGISARGLIDASCISADPTRPTRFGEHLLQGIDMRLGLRMRQVRRGRTCDPRLLAAGVTSLTAESQEVRGTSPGFPH